MKIPSLLLPSLILVATLLGCEAVLAQEKTAPKKADLDAETKALIQKTEKGDAGAQLLLGGMYLYGIGVPKDEAEAYKWYLLAGAQGDEQAKKSIADIEKDLTPAQRAEGKRLARVWKPKK